jgi:TPP-dependent pyruvate/acetoin dehydrogenase alpha subunit
MLPAIAIVGGGNTVVTGIGLAMKLRGRSQVR